MVKDTMGIGYNKELSHEGQGYNIVNDIIPSHYIESIKDKIDMLYPVRASTHKKQYAEGADCKSLFGIAVWWSQLTDEWHEVEQIHRIIFPLIWEQMNDARFYASDIVTINGPSRWISPHVDTPHRFPKYNFRTDDDIYGIQVIIPLDDLDTGTGSTGIVPYSHRQDWNINDCYNGVHDEYFLKSAKQYPLPKGSMLYYNTRLMHSTMPLNLPKKRSVLLINYLKTSIIDDIRKIDNVWTSNGK